MINTQNLMEDQKAIPMEVDPSATVPSLVEICAKLLGQYARYIPDLTCVDEESIDLICASCDYLGLTHIEHILQKDPWGRKFAHDKHWARLYSELAGSFPTLGKKLEKDLDTNDPRGYQKAFFATKLEFGFAITDQLEEFNAIVDCCSNFLTTIRIHFLKHPTAYTLIEKFPLLERVSFAKLKAGPGLAEFLANGISQCLWPRLEKLNLKQTEITSESAVKLVKAINNTQGKMALKHLNMEFNYLDIIVFLELVAYYKKHMGNATLNLVKIRNNFYGKDIRLAQVEMKKLKLELSKVNCTPPNIIFL